MYVLRILGVLLLIGVGLSFLAYAMTGQRSYLGFARRLLVSGAVFALVLFALLVLERLLIIPL